MHTSYKPSGDYLLIKLDKSIEDIKSEQGKSDGGVIVPASVTESEVISRPIIGTVVAAGPDAALGKSNGAPSITPGQRVDFFLFRSFPRKIEGVVYVQINANQILGVVGTPKIEVVIPTGEGDAIRN